MPHPHTAGLICVGRKTSQPSRRPLVADDIGHPESAWCFRRRSGMGCRPRGRSKCHAGSQLHLHGCLQLDEPGRVPQRGAVDGTMQPSCGPRQSNSACSAAEESARSCAPHREPQPARATAVRRVPQPPGRPFAFFRRPSSRFRAPADRRWQLARLPSPPLAASHALPFPCSHRRSPSRAPAGEHLDLAVRGTTRPATLRAPRCGSRTRRAPAPRATAPSLHGPPTPE